MDIIQELKRKAGKNKKIIVFPEAFDSRIMRAMGELAREEVITPLLLGDKKELERISSGYNINLKGIKILEPGEAAEEIKKVKAGKARTNLMADEGPEIINHPLYQAALLVKAGLAHGLVGGCCNPRSTFFRICLNCIGLAAPDGVLSAFKLLFFPKESALRDKVLALADTAVRPDPDSKELAAIAINTADSFKSLLDITPRVAMLSFSTKGSASYPLVDKVKEAVKIAQANRPDLPIDGELQLDAALFPQAARLKKAEPLEASESAVAGQANVLIFPDLNSGNIGSKIFERFAGVRAISSSLQGLKNPAGHLSRSVSTEEVISLAILTALR